MRKKCAWVVLLCTGLLIALSVVILSRPGPALYRVTVLPSLNGLNMVPRSINDRGQVVGVAGPDNGMYRLFCWDHERGIQALGPVCDSHLDNNNAGQIVGTMTDPNGKKQAFLRDPGRGTILLGTLGGSLSSASALNNRGQVVGCLFVPVGGAGDRDVAHAFLWDEAGGLRDLGTAGGWASEAYGISDTGRVVGICASTQDGRRIVQSCCWETADAIVPGTLPQGPHYNHMSNGGRVVGYDSGTDGSHVVLWDDDAGLRRLFACKADDADVRMTALIVNDINQVACSETHQRNRRGPWARLTKRLYEPRVRSYVWDAEHGRIPLDRYVPRGMRNFTVRDLNNRGDIVGEVRQRDGSSGAVLLEPIPERWGRR